MAKRKKTGTLDFPQLSGAGVVGVKIPDLDKAAAKYERKKDERCAASPGEIAAKNELRELLHANRDKLPLNSEGQRFYRADNVDYILEEKLKRRAADDGEVRAETL